MRRAILFLLLLLTPGIAAAEWHQASSAHFLVYSEGSAESVRDFATRLERFDKAMRVLHRLPEVDRGPAGRVTVYVVSNMDAVRRMARGAENVAGFYIPRAEGSVAFTPRRAGSGSRFDIDAENVLLHEYAHHFLFQNYAETAFPAWFAEGFAELSSTARFGRDGGVGFGLPAIHRGYELLLARNVPVERRLATPEKPIATVGEIAALYAKGWLLTHFLTFERGREGQLNAYLTALNAGKTSAEAARSAFGDLTALDRLLNDYMGRRRLNYIDIAARAITIAPVTVRRLTTGEAAVIRLQMISRRGVTAAEAKDLVPRFRRAAAPFANDPAVQTALAEAEYDAGNLAEAEAAADRALAVEPNRIDALIYRGRVALSRAEKAADDDRAPWIEARRRIAAANRADPNDPEPLILFYGSFAAQGIAPTANAVTGLNHAFDLAPQDRGLRLLAARQYLVDGKVREARAALAPLAFDPHGGDAARGLQEVLARLDAGARASDALAAWNRIAATDSGGDKDEETPAEGAEPSP